jgi:NAD(P)H-nitrite reductase large subunit
VIIGNGGAGVSALQTIRGVDKTSDITIISQEKFPAYSPCSLPNLLSGEVEEQKVFRFSNDFYQRLNVKFIKNTEALQIYPGKREIKLTGMPDIKFDKLLIAAGASPIVPEQIGGLDLKGVHVMGTLDSTLKIISHIEQGVDRAVVVGGGFMGIETAVMMRKRGMEVSVIELLPQILSRMLDPDVSEKVVRILEDNGINLVLNDAVKDIGGKKTVESVSLRKKTLECDMVVMAIGVAPNVNLVQGSGIKVDRAIIVDSTMKTNKKGIYAAGDIVEVQEQIAGQRGSFAIWPNAVEQGRIAGLNMAGVPTTYAGAEVVNVLDVFDTPVVTMGGTSKDMGKSKALTRSTPDSFKKLLLKGNKILGLQFVGTIKNTGPLYGLMKNGTDVSDLEDRLLDDNLVIMPEVAPFL